MKVVLVGNGSPPCLTQLRAAASSSQYLIAADGGVSHCARAGLIPDLVIGDLDSICEDGLRWAQRHSLVYRFPKDKDHTDLYLAFREAERMGAKSLQVFSWASERIDYSLGIIADFANIQPRVEFIGYLYKGVILNRYHPFLKLKAREKISLFSLSNSTSLKTTGLKWNLDWRNHRALQFSQSNEALRAGSIRLQKGGVFVLQDRSIGA